MCGIAGYAGLDLAAEPAAALLRRMCDSIRHRGPDDDGYFAENSVGLGMRRLSIIDIAGGHQPMEAGDGRYRIVFNGEIYNFRELRDRLEQDGERFATHSDTEVLLRQFVRHGIAGLSALNGMFAFAVWDARDKQLTLVRDRMGVKPLYYYWDGKRLLFGSEIKAILASGVVERKIDEQAIWDYLTYRYVPGPGTIWHNIRKLPPAHVLSLTLDGSAPSIERFWEIPYREAPLAETFDESTNRFATLFEDAVRLRMIADVPVGIMLSGGLDSSAVAAVACRHNNNLNTFSVGFRDAPHTDELPYARLVARHLGTKHHEIVIGQDEFMDFLPEFVRFTDEPLADLASVPLYYVSKLARSEVKVSLSGEGSDEILGGYDLQLRVQQWDAMRKGGGTSNWLSALRSFAHGGYARWDQRAASVPPTMTDYMTSAQKSDLMGRPALPESHAPLRAEIAALGEQDPLHQTLYGFSQHWLTEDLLMKADKMSMATSLELRTPFLDYRLVEWAARSPAASKAGRDENGDYQSKRVLRRFAASILPAEIITRPKQGFPVPVYEWLMGPLKAWATDLLTGAGARLRTSMVPAAIDRLLALGTGAQSGLLDRHRLWNLLVLELWMREWKA
ncbi:asparagine synthase (glutamine-hydrolyzing) [Bradyrhizobium sp. SYSU BS000235]|uniref:asparagine synthase (glutamine-hydrolyzing) n=1 Tax=Bradyrhizobium sp. SYSU BS000235 TaxID=3411332 RepID=UPI003C77E04D